MDCPSGIDCDSGEVADETIPADLTITMVAVKQGLLKLPAFEFVGELQVVEIGLPDDLRSWNENAGRCLAGLWKEVDKVVRNGG